MQSLKSTPAELSQLLVLRSRFSILLLALWYVLHPHLNLLLLLECADELYSELCYVSDNGRHLDLVRLQLLDERGVFDFDQRATDVALVIIRSRHRHPSARLDQPLRQTLLAIVERRFLLLLIT